MGLPLHIISTQGLRLTGAYLFQMISSLQSQPSGIILSNGVQLVPTRLSNGDIAFVLPTANLSPSTSTTASSPLPLLVPIPTRTASRASSASTSSSYSSSASPEPIELKHYSSSVSQKPLSLVVRKHEELDEDKPWRPW